MVAIDQTVRRRHHVLNALGSLLVPLSSLMVAPLLTRSLGPVGQGDFSTSQSIIVVAASVLGLGVSDSLSVYGNFWSRRFRRRARLVVVGTAVVLASCAALIFTGAGFLHPDLVWILAIGALFFAAALVQRGDLLNKNMILEISAEKWITALSRLVLTGLLFFWDQLTVQTAVSTLIVPQLLGFAYLFLVARSRRRIEAIAETRSMRRVSQQPMRTLNWAVIGGLGGVLLVNLDPIVLRPLIGAEQLGYYAIGMLVAELFTVAAKPFRDAALAGGDGRRKAGEFKKVIKWCALVMTLGVVVCCSSLWFVIPWVFGTDFSGAVWPAVILAVGGWAKGLGFLVNGILVKTGHAKLRAYATLGAVALSVAGMVMLSPWGAVGAAIAGALAYAVMLTPGLLFLRSGRSGRIGVRR